MTDVAQLVARLLQGNPLNVLDELDRMRIFDAPIVGVASPGDPLFAALKEEDVVGPHHRSPREWLPGAAAVISYFLPFSARVREANRCAGWPATEWLYGRIEGEALNNDVRGRLVAELQGQGFEAVAPPLHSDYEVVELRSNWSERHIAFIAGLGTFNLGRSLITRKGCAGRIGSVVTTMPLGPSKRSYREVYEYCTHCWECIKRCPAGAIDKQGKSHEPCSRFIHETIQKRYSPRYGCGKCQTAVPCEDRIPS